MTVEFQVRGDDGRECQVLSVQDMDAAPREGETVLVLRRGNEEFEQYCVERVGHCIIGEDSSDWRESGYRRLVIMKRVKLPAEDYKEGNAPA